MDSQLLFSLSSAIPFTSKTGLTNPHSFSQTRNYYYYYNTNKFFTNKSSIKFHTTATRQNDAAAPFSEAAYEAERLSLDAEARDSMAQKSEMEAQNPTDPKAWKWVIRKRVWDLMEARNIAQFPRPVHHRIPNFVGAHIAAAKLSELEVFKESNCVKVNPDTPQKQVRFLTLEGQCLKFRVLDMFSGFDQAICKS